MGPMNTQGEQDTTDTLNADQLDQLEQSDRLGGSGTLLGADESVGQVDATDQHALDGLSGEDSDTQTDTQAGTTSNMNAYSGMPAAANDTSRTWSASSGLVGATPTDTANSATGLEGNTTEGVSNAGLEDPQVQEALDPNLQGNAMGNGPMAKDPVCGVMVDISTAQNTLSAPVGSTVQTLYFDSPECKALFEANPDQYIANY